MKFFTARILGPLMLLALLPVLAIASPGTSADAARAADGLSQATAAGSCWEIKQNTPAAPDGIYWLITPALQAPQQFYCDQTTSGGGWVLIGRGRQGWKNHYNGLGTPANLRGTITGPAAFLPAQLPALTVDGLLNNTPVSGLADGIRLRRAADRAGSTWQEVRFKIPTQDRWVWTFGSERGIGSFSFSGAGGSASGSGGKSVDWGIGSSQQRVNSTASPDSKVPDSQGYLWGFAYGTSINLTLNGTNDDGSYIWSKTNNTPSGRPFTQMFLRPQLRRDTIFTASVPDSGTAKSQVRALPDSNATKTVWGVSGLADGIDSELHTEVQSFAQIGNTMFVGGDFKFVQKDKAGTGQVLQPNLAGFDVTSGELVNPTTFKPTFDRQVKALAALPDGRLAVGGEFTTVNGVDQPGLALLDPITGALSGPQVRVEKRNGDGVAVVKGLHVNNGLLYLAGSFTHLVGGTTTGSATNGGRVIVSTSRPDTNWNPAMTGTSVGVNASPKDDRAYFAGYFLQAKGEDQTNITAIGTAAGAPLASSGIDWHTSANVPADGVSRFWQLDVQEVNDRFFYGGSQHSIFSYDRDNLAAGVKSGTMTRAGGDVQTITANPTTNTVFAGCHCGDYAYQDVYNVYPSVAGFTQADSINTFGAWNSTDGKTLPEFNPIVIGRKGYGAWGMIVDSRGTLWVGGDYVSSIRAGYNNQWSGAFMRFAARDATAPSTPSNLTSTNVDATSFRLNWGASTDNVSGAITYEVIEGNKVIATTTTTSAVVTRLSGSQRYFVRALDVGGNRSASTPVLTVSDPSNQPPPTKPVVTGQALSPTSIRLTWPDQTAAGGFIIKRDGNQVGTRPSGATSYDDTGLAESTTYTYTVTAVDDLGQQTSSAPVDVKTQAATSEVKLVQASTPWRWRFASTAPGSGWESSPTFDDSTWTSSVGPYGFGTSLANTDISVGAPSPRPLSAHFRTTFQVPDVNAIDAPSATFVVDDGLVVYVNGVEVRRQNMPAGTITQNSYATAAPRSAAADASPVTMTIPKSALVNGTNVVAAETHLNYRSSTDALFRLTMTATPADPGTPAPPAKPVVSAQSNSPTTVKLTWPNQTDATGGFVVKRGGAQVGPNLPPGSTSFDDSGLTAGTQYSYTVTAMDDVGQQTTSNPVLVTTQTTTPQAGFIEADKTWRWRYAASSPDSSWQTAGYDDTTWSSGTGSFGFGSGLVTTDISVGAPSPKPLAAQFRTTFEVPDITAVGDSTLTFVADDGAVVYVNGVEVRRQNIADGITISQNTYANAAPRSSSANAAPVVMTVPASALVQGTNVVTAETHLNYRSTPDALFRLTLSATAP